MTVQQPKYQVGINFNGYNNTFQENCRLRGCHQAAQLARALRLLHLYKDKTHASYDTPVPSADKLKIFSEASRIVHRNTKTQQLKLGGQTTFADEETATLPAQENEEFKVTYERVINILQRDEDAVFDGKKPDGSPDFSDDEHKIIEIIRDYIKNFRVLCPEDVQNMIDYMALAPDQRQNQNKTLRTMTQNQFGDTVTNLANANLGVDAYISVLQALDGCSSSPDAISASIFDTINTWATTDMQDAQLHFAKVQKLVESMAKFGQTIDPKELKRTTITALLRWSPSFCDRRNPI